MRWLASTSLLLAALVLSACGGEDAPDAADAPPARSEPDAEPAARQIGEGIRVTKAVGRPNSVFEVDGRPRPPKLVVPPGPPPEDLVVEVLKKGVGEMRAKWGQRLSVQYVGVNYRTKEEFEYRWGESGPFSFTFGSGEVRDGWETGLKGMRLGGQRELALPSRLAYGTGALLYVVELVAIEPLPKSPYAT